MRNLSDILSDEQDIRTKYEERLRNVFPSVRKVVSGATGIIASVIAAYPQDAGRTLIIGIAGLAGAYTSVRIAAGYVYDLLASREIR